VRFSPVASPVQRSCSGLGLIDRLFLQALIVELVATHSRYFLTESVPHCQRPGDTVAQSGFRYFEYVPIFPWGFPLERRLLSSENITVAMRSPNQSFGQSLCGLVLHEHQYRYNFTYQVCPVTPCNSRRSFRLLFSGEFIANDELSPLKTNCLFTVKHGFRRSGSTSQVK
jgi:hypothetical protein